ncbi:hypothetical protein FEM48_Zijuj04G0053200 [Ziziphus jujuba var. spinosa]|uniref:Leucine-rich repeat-containing N-terminal plant-type domain-containing protein n=1 Tax=Ziziphus jujuba var. spinosa TaxID=714518 RepID=A0A978VI10_ZIZJJ|nr:hypothetical protein FEM48_Zijuj04G0053200 [Ziziphus jujuba var. spinosa]
MGSSSSSSSSVIKWHLLHRPPTSKLVVLLRLFLLLWIFSVYHTTVAALADSDKSVLLEFKKSVSDPSGLLSSWNSIGSGYCSWFGVSCDSNLRVVSLNITGNGSGGNSNSFSCSDFAQFPLYGSGISRSCSASSRGKLVGKLSPVIGKLTELRILSLPFNGFDGEIPSEIWGMGNLEVLDLEGNSIAGRLPVQFNRNLRVLNLGFNKIEGDIPSSLSNSVNLEILNLAGNRVNGTVPAFVGRLREVYLSYNSLSGSVPSEIGENCGKLEHLDLSGNYLVHGIPRSLGNCGELRALLLYSNMLEESIPAELGRLQKLEVFDVSRNSLSGSIPSQLGNCSQLSVLVLSNLFNPLPKGKFAEDNSSLEQLNSMNDDFNYFQGPIPEDITRLPNLRILWAPRATLEGGFPNNWGACDNIEMINLAQNFFTGEIRNSLSHCKKLNFLDLSWNRLTGKLVEDLPVPCMTVFDVSGNFLSGSIPEFFNSTCSSNPFWSEFSSQPDNPSSLYQAFFASQTQDGNALQLHGEDGDITVFHNFGHNNFTGTLQSLPIAPERLGKRTSYAYFAGENKLTGGFPGSLFEKCEGLDALILNISYNKLSGQIPDEIGTMCISLKFMDASGNHFTGPIPPSIGELVSLTSLNLSWNILQDQIPTSLGQIKNLKYLSLSGNNLTGSIPSSLGQLHALEVLELSSNSLTGEIPKFLENLHNLTVLLLDKNKLSGQIPSGLANVTTLSVFNVSFNNLSGLLPSNNSLMRCNSAIGNPLLRSCMYSLAGPATDPQGRVGDPQSYAASPSGVPTEKSGNNGFNSIEIASITSASAIVSVLLALIVLFFYTRKWNPKSKVLGSTRKEVTLFTDIGVPLTFETVVRATGSFNASNCIGNGGFGATYKAEISPGVLVAIKRLAGRAKEFFTAGLWDAGPQDDMVEVLHLAVVCTVDSLSTRPTMRQVVRRLKQLQPPSC